MISLVLGERFSVPTPASAAGLVIYGVRMSSQETGKASDQHITILTTLGIQNAASTITYSFPGFDLSSVTSSDISLTYINDALDDLATTTEDLPKPGGIWGASISGTTITITPPTDAGAGTVSANSIFGIKIGKDVHDLANQIVNPATPGTYEMSVARGFGESGVKRIPIFASENLITVSATVEEETGFIGGGGGAPVLPPPPEEPPSFALEILNIQVTPHSNDAVITFETTTDTVAFISYGLAIPYDKSATDNLAGTFHSIVLPCDPDSLYHYQINVQDAWIRKVESADATFRTLAIDEVGPANPSNFRAIPGNGMVNLSWVNPPETDFAGVVLVGKTGTYPTNLFDGRKFYEGTGTGAQDTDVINDTQYYYAIYAIDTSGNVSSGALAQAKPSATLPSLLPPLVITETPFVKPLEIHVSPYTYIPPGSVQPPLEITPTTIPPAVLVPGLVTTTVIETPPPVIYPPYVPPVGAQELPLTPRFYVAQGKIELIVDATGRMETAAGNSVIVRIQTLDLPAVPLRGSVQVGDSLYQLTLAPDGDAWSASFVPSSVAGRTNVTVRMEFSNGNYGIAERVIDTRAVGRVVEAGARNAITAVKGAKITVYEIVNGSPQLWDATRFGQVNPLITGEQGTFLFQVPNGNYRLVATKDDYTETVQDVRVSNNLIALDVVIKPAPPSIVPTVQEVVEDVQVITQEVTKIAENFVQDVNTVVEAVRTPEVVAVTKNVVAPVVTVAAVSTVATAASAFNIFNYLRFLITQPFLLLGRRKRKKWGLVYNALTKAPIDLAIVRLLDGATNRVLMTRITDAKGRFALNVKPGKYKIEAVKQGYVFPSPSMLKEKQDIELVDLYHGEVIEVKENAIITPNIPVDPVAKMETPKIILLKRTLRKIQNASGIVTMVISVGALVIVPSMLMAGLCVFQVGSYFLFRKFSVPTKPVKWGVVYDAKKRVKLERVVVRIFDKKFNKLLETQVTDADGRYGFIASKNIYYITAEKKGYAKFVSPDVNMLEAQETIVDLPVPLQAVA